MQQSKIVPTLQTSNEIPALENTDIRVQEDQEKKRQKRLTIKERDWIKEYIKTGDATKAALKVYRCGSMSSASSIGSQNLKRLNYQDIMEQFGLSDRLLLTKLQEGLYADKVVGITKKNKKIVHPDFHSQHRYLETALKLKKRLTNNNEQQDSVLMGLSIIVQKQ